MTGLACPVCRGLHTPHGHRAGIARQEYAALKAKWLRRFGSFYCLLLRRAFPGAWAAAWITSSVFAILGGSVAIWRPFENNTMNVLIGLLPLTVFLAIMIAGPLLAAYLVFGEEVEKRVRAEQERDALQEQLRD